MSSMDEAITNFNAREGEIRQQAEEVRSAIRSHADQSINQIKLSMKNLLNEVDVIMKKKLELLENQRENAESVQEQITSSVDDGLEQPLKDMTEQQLSKSSQDVNPEIFRPVESANICFTPKNVFSLPVEIGTVSSSVFGKATIKPAVMLLANKKSTATVVLQSQDGSPFSLSPSLISCDIYPTASPQQLVKCCVEGTKQEGEYSLAFTPATDEEHCLKIKVGSITSSEFVFCVGGSLNKMAQTPYGMSVTSSSECFIIEKGMHCVTVVDKSLKKVQSFGRNSTGNGEFDFPYRTCVTHDNHVLVTDNHQLQKFTFEGKLVKSIGSNSSGSGTNEFHWPIGIAADPTTGRIFVADSNNKRVQVFDCNLTYERTISAEQFFRPWGIALDDSGYLYVADYKAHCIIKLTIEGKYIKRFGSEGSSQGKLFYPSSLVIHHGLVYVCEEGNQRLSVFNSQGEFLHCSGESFDRPCGITVDIEGTKQEGKYSLTFTPATDEERHLKTKVGSITSNAFVCRVAVGLDKITQSMEDLDTPYGVSVTSSGECFITEKGAHCITVVDKSLKKVQSFGKNGTGDGEFDFPYRTCVTRDNHVLVTDNHRLQKFTFEGKLVKSIGSNSSGSGTSEFHWPIGIAADPATGRIFVADSNNKRVQVFDSNLTYERTISPEQFFRPWGIALDDNGHLYVADYKAHCIIKLTTTGEYIEQFGSEGPSPGQLFYPSSLAIYCNMVYVCEEGNQRVSVFDSQGEFLYCSSSGESFDRPCGITVDSFGSVYVCDFRQNKIVVY